MGAGRGCIRGNLLQNTTLLHVRAARLCHFNESSCGATFIAMMQTTNLREGNNLTSCWRVYWTRLGAILVEREMRSGFVMVLKIPRQNCAQVMLVKDNDVIQTFAADRTDKALTYGFWQGDRGAVTTSLMPITRTRSRKTGPYDASRSRSK